MVPSVNAGVTAGMERGEFTSSTIISSVSNAAPAATSQEDQEKCSAYGKGGRGSKLALDMKSFADCLFRQRLYSVPVGLTPLARTNVSQSSIHAFIRDQAYQGRGGQF